MMGETLAGRKRGTELRFGRGSSQARRERMERQVREGGKGTKREASTMGVEGV